MTASHYLRQIDLLTATTRRIGAGPRAVRLTRDRDVTDKLVPGVAGEFRVIADCRMTVSTSIIVVYYNNVTVNRFQWFWAKKSSAYCGSSGRIPRAIFSTHCYRRSASVVELIAFQTVVDRPVPEHGCIVPYSGAR